MSRVRKWLTYGNVTATIAIFLAMSGAAVAVTTAPKNSVTSASIKDGEVRSADVRDGAVTAAKIRSDSVGSGKAIDGSLNSADIRDDSLDQRDLGASSVGNTELADNSVGSSKIQPGEVTSTDISDSGILSQDIVGNQIGAREVKDLTAATSPVGTSISPGHAGNAAVTCPDGGMVVGGGYAWEDDAFTWVIYSTPSEADPTHTWTVRGYVPAGGNSNRLYAWASCLNH
jgi:hypothetical protein